MMIVTIYSSNSIYWRFSFLPTLHSADHFILINRQLHGGPSAKYFIFINLINPLDMQGRSYYHSSFYKVENCNLENICTMSNATQVVNSRAQGLPQVSAAGIVIVQLKQRTARHLMRILHLQGLCPQHMLKACEYTLKYTNKCSLSLMYCNTILLCVL